MTATISPAQRLETALKAPTLHQLRELASRQAPKPLVVTAYLRLGVQDRIRCRYRIALRDAMQPVRSAAEAPDRSHEEHEAIQRDLRRIEDAVENPARLPHAPGLVLIACEALEILASFPLSRVLRTRVRLADRPELAEALCLTERIGRVLVAAIDRAHARFFEVTPFDVEELAGLHLAATRGGKHHGDRRDAPGWGERDYHNRIREERHRHAAATARHLTELTDSEPFQGLVLAGPAKSIAEQIPFLPRPLREKLMGTARLNPTSVSPAAVRAAALKVQAEWALDQQRQLATELNDAVGTGWAVNGARETLRALARGQVRQLLIPAGLSAGGFRCQASGRLVLAKADCKGEGDPVPVDDLVNDLIEEAMQQGIEVATIDIPAIAEEIDGLAGFLRFR